MRSFKKVLIPLAALVCALCLGACGYTVEEETEEETIPAVKDYTFQIEEGPTLNISIDTTGGYNMYVASQAASAQESTEDSEDKNEEETEEVVDIDFGEADFVITYGDDTIYGAFMTVSETTEAELFFYDSYEEYVLNDTFSGFKVQTSDSEYNLFLELEDRDFLCLYAYEEDIDLSAAANQLTITFETEEESSSEAE